MLFVCEGVIVYHQKMFAKVDRFLLSSPASILFLAESA
jgi:hypothetical protein